jgi:superfamily I DNA/RNA helicase
MGGIATAVIGSFSIEIDGVLEDYEAFKRRAAVLDFDDLLHTCRQVLRDFPVVRSTAGERFSRILVDEFQDTDPVQAELIFLLCSGAADAAAWQRRPLRLGQLFLVGDPKQAIDRFRGADLATYMTVRQAIEDQFPDNVVRVSANFRSRDPILDHINERFSLHLSQQEAGVGLARLTGKVTLHTLRHTAATWLMQRGVPVWEAAGFLGMSAEVLLGTYRHHHPDFLHGAANAIASKHRVSVVESVVELESARERRQKANVSGPRQR